MTNVIGGRFADAMLSTGGACMVVVGIAAIDERVRLFLASVLTSDPSSELVQAGVRVQRFARIVMETANTHGIEPVAVAFLAVASVILATLMLRT